MKKKMPVKDLLHEMKNIECIWLASKDRGGLIADNAKISAMERALKLFDEIVLHLKVKE